MTRLLRPHRRGFALGMLAVMLLTRLTAGAVSLAYFTDQANVSAAISAGRVFEGTRTTSAFVVGDASGGGTEVDRSSPFVVAGDGLTVPTGAWDAAFASGRFLAFDLSAPLPAGVATSGLAFQLTFSRTSASGTACLYADVRRASDDAVLATYGGPGSPLSCTGGTTPTSLAIPLPVIATTDAADDLRVRVYAQDSADTAFTVDQATASGSMPFAVFTLYPVRFTDATGLTSVTSPWDLQGP